MVAVYGCWCRAASNVAFCLLIVDSADSIVLQNDRVCYSLSMMQDGTGHQQWKSIEGATSTRRFFFRAAQKIWNSLPYNIVFLQIATYISSWWFQIFLFSIVPYLGR